MAGVVPVNPVFQFLDDDGDPLVGGTVDVYLAGTTTRTNSWQDKTQLTLNTNPIVLDARGECAMWFDDALTYKLVLKDSAGTTVWTADNVPGSSAAASQVSFTAAGTGAVSRTVQSKLREFVSVGDFGTVGASEAADNAMYELARASISNDGWLVNPKGSRVNFQNVTVPNGLVIIDMVSGTLISSSTAFGKSVQAGGLHLLMKDVRTDTGTRVHIEPRGNPSGTKGKLDTMWDDYEATGSAGYRVHVRYTFDDESTATQGYCFDGPKATGKHFGIWPVWHMGFSDAGATAVPMSLYYIDFSDANIFSYAPLKGAWRAGRAYTTNDYVVASNNIYRAASTATSGDTIPSHTAGTVSDGGVNWLFVKNCATTSNNIKPVVVLGERDDRPKVGTTLQDARTQFSRATVTHNGIEHRFLDASGNITWKQFAPVATDDFRISNSAGTKFQRFDETGAFVQFSGLSFLPSTVTAADGDTTPSLAGAMLINLGNTSPITYTAFDGGTSNQLVLARAGNGNGTLTHSASLSLVGGISRTMRTGEVVLFQASTAGTALQEVSSGPALLSGSATFDPPDLTAGATQQTTVTVTGAVVGDIVSGVSHSQANADILWFGQVTAANTVTVTQWNRGGGAVNLASGTLRVFVRKTS